MAWHDPYPPPHGGDLEGRTAVLRAVFDAAGELTAGTGRFWLVDQVVIGWLVVALVGWTAEYRRRRIETRELAVYRVADDRIAEAWFYPEDPEESWRFFADDPDAEPPEGLSGTPHRFMHQLVRMRATAEQTQGAFGLVDIETPPGSGPHQLFPPQREHRADGLNRFSACGWPARTARKATAMTTRAAGWLDRFAAALWILAIAFGSRPLGMLEASGMMLSLWEDVLPNVPDVPNVPDEELAAAAGRVAEAMDADR